MAAATAVVSGRDNESFRGLFSDTWTVTCTLNSASVADQAAGTDTVTVPGVALGDMVIGMSAGVSEAGLVRRAYVSAADTVTIATTNTTGGAVDIASTTVKLVIARTVSRLGGSSPLSCFGVNQWQLFAVCNLVTQLVLPCNMTLTQ